jgi:hypothetical protein
MQQDYLSVLIIVTRDVSGFVNAEIPVVLPENLTINNDGLSASGELSC